MECLISIIIGIFGGIFIAGMISEIYRRKLLRQYNEENEENSYEEELLLYPINGIIIYHN